MKSKVALAVAIALAILTAVGIRAYVRQKVEERAGVQKLVPILIASRNIKKGETVFSDMIAVEEVPQSAVLDGGTLTRGQERRIVRQEILKDVNAGAPLRASYFSTRRTKREDPAEGMPVGYRDITIPVDKVTGCAGRLLPWTTVDVLVTLRVRRDANSPIEPVTQTVLTGMSVVATDLHSREIYTFLSDRQRRDFASYSTVTLRALPLQATLLAFLADQGKLHLIIRSPDDPTGKDPSTVDKVTLDNLDTLIRKAAAEKPPDIPAPEQPRRRR